MGLFGDITTSLKAAAVNTLLDRYPNQKSKLPMSTATVQNWHSNYDINVNSYVNFDELTADSPYSLTQDQLDKGKSLFNVVAKLYDDGDSGNNGISVNDINALAQNDDSISVEDLVTPIGLEEVKTVIAMI